MIYLKIIACFIAAIVFAIGALTIYRIIVAAISVAKDKEYDESCLPESNSDCLSDYLKHNEELLKGK